MDRGRAEEAVGSRVGAKLGLDARMAALGVSEMVDENMSNAARTHAIEWGKGLGGRTVIAFGGSAPIHAARLADKLELDRFLVPGDAGVGSAVGFLLAPISYEVVRSRYMRLLRFDPGLVREVLAGMRAEAVGGVGEGAPGPEGLRSQLIRACRCVPVGYVRSCQLSRGTRSGWRPDAHPSHPLVPSHLAGDSRGENEPPRRLRRTGWRCTDDPRACSPSPLVRVCAWLSRPWPAGSPRHRPAPGSCRPAGTRESKAATTAYRPSPTPSPPRHPNGYRIPPPRRIAPFPPRSTRE